MAESGDVTGEMTLAFSLAALDQLADPASAFEDARDWSSHVGVVDTEPEDVASAVADHDLPQAFEMAEDDDIWLALERIRATTATQRHVYVGATAEHRRVATELGWEYVPVTEAAAKAGWRLDTDPSGAGPFTRLRERLTALLPGFGDG